MRHDIPSVMRVVWRCRFAPTATSIFLLALSATPGFSATPESPEVKQMVQRAIGFIQKERASEAFGVESLRALALVKGDCPLNHPRISRAVRLCREALRSFEAKKHDEKIVYEVAVSIIFLCELDAGEYKAEITQFMDHLMSWQKEAGGWGYLEGPHRATGDISQTQYVILAIWTAERTGAYKLNVEAIEKVTNYLIRVQDPSGGWGYQGVDPGEFRRVKQMGVQHSLTAAGVGSLYICADLLRLTKGAQMSRRYQANIPTALKVVRSPESKLGPLSDRVDLSLLTKAMADGNAWLERNYTISPEDWPSYYMYAFERYQSFRELAENVDVKEPKWYNDGVDFLKSKQNGDGSWDFDYKYDTSFAVLFLTRGTKKSIQKAEGYGGLLKGGRGLPADTTNVLVSSDGTIVKTPFQGQAETLLAMLEAEAGEDFDASVQDIKITLSDDPVKREAEIARLTRLLAAEEFKIRYAAVKALAGTNELDVVPALIFALDDPDRRVVVVARDALRRISRKFSGFGLSDNPTEAEKITAVNRWKEWYRLIRPSAKFLK